MSHDSIIIFLNFVLNYNRNIIESLMTAWHKILKPKSFHLSLAHLTVIEKSYNEMLKIFECLPCLNEVILRSVTFAGSKYNANHKLLWSKLLKISLFMKSSSIGDFESFCKNGYTQNLTELMIEMEVSEYLLILEHFPVLNIRFLFQGVSFTELKNLPW